MEATAVSEMKAPAPTVDQALAFFDVLLGTNYMEHGAVAKSPYVRTHLQAALGLDGIPTSAHEVIYIYTEQDEKHSRALLGYLQAVVNVATVGLEARIAERKRQADEDLPF